MESEIQGSINITKISAGLVINRSTRKTKFSGAITDYLLTNPITDSKIQSWKNILKTFRRWWGELMAKPYRIMEIFQRV